MGYKRASVMRKKKKNVELSNSNTSVLYHSLAKSVLKAYSIKYYKMNVISKQYRAIINGFSQDPPLTSCM